MQLAVIRRNKPTGPDGIPWEIPKPGREAIILYLARLLDIKINNASTPEKCRNARVVPIYKGGD
jgi:hypothetical protein